MTGLSIPNGGRDYFGKFGPAQGPRPGKYGALSSCYLYTFMSWFLKTTIALPLYRNCNIIHY